MKSEFELGEKLYSLASSSSYKTKLTLFKIVLMTIKVQKLSLKNL